MKIFYTLLLVAFLSLVSSLKAQTNVSGFINANTNWTLAGSPYIVTGNALLSQGFTLTIDPGVEVRFGTNNALQIDGQLIAIGTPSQRIVFTSNQSNPQPGDWAKLHFSDFSVDAVYDAAGNYVSGTIMKYCDVLYGGSLMWGSIDIQQCSPYFNHCRITNGSWCGINFNGDHLTIDTTLIRDFPKRGIYYQGGHYLFRNDTFYGCAEGAIHMIQSYDGFQSHILDSYFRMNYGALSNGGQYTTIANCTFVYNYGPSVIQLGGSHDTVSCNRFMYNTGGGAISWPGGGGVIYNNHIEYNTNNNGPSVIGLSTGWYSDTMYISNNTITHNSSPGRSCCEMNVNLNSMSQNFLQIYNNIFTENDGADFMKLYGPQNNDPSFDFLYLDSNTFNNPMCQYELNNGILYGSPNLMIPGNYWGNTNTTYVDGVIYDYFDFANQSVVYYMPILLTPIVIDTSCQPFQLPLGVGGNHSFTHDVRIYPNPATNQFVVQLPSSPNGDQIFVLRNPIGQEVKRAVLTQQEQVISCEEIAEGVYFYSILEEGDLTGSGKFIKQ